MEFLRPNKKHCGAIRRRVARVALGFFRFQNDMNSDVQNVLQLYAITDAVAFGVMAE
jgi:hypothetical protein